MRRLAAVIILVLRHTVAVLLLVGGLLLLLFAVGFGGAVDDTIVHSRKIEREFQDAAMAVETFTQSHGRRPTEVELESILRPRDNYTMLASVGFDQCDRDLSAYRGLGEPDYVLATWRGEWWECYAPTRGMSTLIMDRNLYAFSGWVLLDQAVIALVGVALFIASFWFWWPLGPKPTRPGEA